MVRVPVSLFQTTVLAKDKRVRGVPAPEDRAYGPCVPTNCWRVPSGRVSAQLKIWVPLSSLMYFQLLLKSKCAWISTSRPVVLSELALMYSPITSAGRASAVGLVGSG